MCIIRNLRLVESVVKSSPQGQKRPPLNRRYIYMHLHEWKVLYFDENFTKDCSQVSNQQYHGIGLENALAPNRRQAIIWINADQIHWQH